MSLSEESSNAPPPYPSAPPQSDKHLSPVLERGESKVALEPGTPAKAAQRLGVPPNLPQPVTMQPQPTAVPVVVAMNQTSNVHNHIHGKRNWDKDLFGCDWHCGNKKVDCCVNICCPGFGVADVQMREGYTHFAALALGMIAHMGSPFGCALPSPLSACVVCLVRQEFRRKHGFKGHWCRDCCASLLCSPLVIGQMQKQQEKFAERERLIKNGNSSAQLIGTSGGASRNYVQGNY